MVNHFIFCNWVINIDKNHELSTFTNLIKIIYPKIYYQILIQIILYLDFRAQIQQYQQHPKHYWSYKLNKYFETYQDCNQLLVSTIGRY